MDWIDILLTVVIGLVILVVGIFLGRKFGLNKLRRIVK